MCLGWLQGSEFEKCSHRIFAYTSTVQTLFLRHWRLVLLNFPLYNILIGLVMHSTHGSSRRHSRYDEDELIVTRLDDVRSESYCRTHHHHSSRTEAYSSSQRGYSDSSSRNRSQLDWDPPDSVYSTSRDIYREENAMPIVGITIITQTLGPGGIQITTTARLPAESGRNEMTAAIPTHQKETHGGVLGMRMVGVGTGLTTGGEIMSVSNGIRSMTEILNM